MKRVASIITVALTAIVLMVSCAPKAKVVTMGTNAEFPPFEYRDSDKIVGIDADIAAQIAADKKVELKIEDMSFDSLIAAVSSGKIDFAAAGMTVTEERKQNVDFSTPYYLASQMIIVKQDSKVAASADLAGKRIGVQQGTTGDTYCTDKIPTAKLERYNKGFEAIQALVQDKVDAVIIDSSPAKVFVSQNAGLKVLDEPLTQEEYAIAVKKGNTKLLDSINATLKRLTDSGELDKTFAKYLSN